MTFVLSLALLFAVFVVAPKWMSISILSAIIGLATGGFAWSLAAMAFPSLIDVKCFIGFIVFGTVIAYFIVMSYDK